MSAYEKLDEQKKFACRVIADHARATAFSIADGILPANEGRNYVLRKIMRRAIYQGRHTLGFEGLFFHKVTNFVIDQMGEAYPELQSHREVIDKIVSLEEERFGNTLTVGLQKLEELVSSQEAQMRNGAFDFRGLARLVDTYGVPKDLIRVALEERGFVFNEDEFLNHLDQMHVLLQAGTGSFKVNGGTAELTVSKAKAKPIYTTVASRIQSLFRGYETTRVDDAKVLALIRGDEEVLELSESQEGEAVLDQTPFYAESGGQVGDVGKIVRTACGSGRLISEDPSVPTSDDQPSATAGGTDFMAIKVEKGILKVGDTVTAEVDVEKRDATRRNHTATHLVHAALREVLGAHVKQAGSVVAPNYLRFDFTHYQPMTEDEIKEVERLVNEQVLRNVKVETDVMPVEEAIRSGAMALFGEKYSGMMRVLTVPGFSKELCGGTHVRATGDIGVFKITSDESIASGVRRIRAVTGIDAYQRFREDEEIIEEVTSNLRTSRAELPSVIGRLQDELKKARREADELRLKIATGAAGSAASNGDDAREVAGVKILAREASGLDAAGMRQLSDTLLARIKSGVVVLGRSNDGKASLIVRTSDDLTKRVPAGQVIKELAPIIGGRGGGKPDMAEGGGNQPEKLSEALQASYGVIERMLT